MKRRKSSVCVKPLNVRRLIDWLSSFLLYKHPSVEKYTCSIVTYIVTFPILERDRGEECRRRRDDTCVDLKFGASVMFLRRFSCLLFLIVEKLRSHLLCLEVCWFFNIIIISVFLLAGVGYDYLKHYKLKNVMHAFFFRKICIA